MEARVKKWGNSLGIRIPRALAEDVGLKENAVVDLTSEGGQLWIRPQKRTYLLNELLAQVTDDNIHSETNWGGPVGKELW